MSRSVRSKIIHGLPTPTWSLWIMSSLQFKIKIRYVWNYVAQRIMWLRAQTKKCAKSFFGCVITVSRESQRLNKHKVSKPDCFFCCTHTMQCKNTYKQILVGENYRSLKNTFSLCVGMNLPVDCRGKHSFWVCFWEKKTHGSKVGYVIDIKWELWSKHILNFFPSKKESGFTVNLLSFMAWKLHYIKKLS